MPVYAILYFDHWYAKIFLLPANKMDFSSIISLEKEGYC